MQWKYLQICQWEPEEGTVWDKEEPLPERYPSVELKPEWKNLGYSVLNTSFPLSSWIFFLNFMEMSVWQNFFNVFSLSGEQDIGVLIQEKPNLREFLFIKRKKKKQCSGEFQWNICCSGCNSPRPIIGVVIYVCRKWESRGISLMW